MSATEDKSLAHRYIHAANTFGLFPALCLPVFTSFSINAHPDVFPDATSTPDFGVTARSQTPEKAEKYIGSQFPVLKNVRRISSNSSWVGFIHSFSDVSTGNSAVYRLAKLYDARTLPISFTIPDRRKVALELAPAVAAAHAPSSMLSGHALRAESADALPTTDETRWDLMADFADDILSKLRRKQYSPGHQKWKRGKRYALSRSYKHEVDPEQERFIGAVADPPSTPFTQCASRFSRKECLSVHIGPGYAYIWIRGTTDVAVEQGAVDEGLIARDSRASSADDTSWERQQEWQKRTRRDLSERPRGKRAIFFPTRSFSARGSIDGEVLIGSATRLRTNATKPKSKRGGTLIVLTERDLQDLKFLAASHARDLQYRRSMICRTYSEVAHKIVRDVLDAVGSLKMQIWEIAAKSDHYSARVGAYWDMIESLVHSSLAGNRFINHYAQNMGRIAKHGLEDFPHPAAIVDKLKRVAPELAQEAVAQARLALYPELDRFGVVSEQYELHMSPLKTDFEEGSPEAVRVGLTKQYLWYYAIIVLHSSDPSQPYPGRIREGVTVQDWHQHYITKGIPSNCWHQAHDVDLSGTFPIIPLDNRAYVKAADSACLPSKPRQISTYDNYMKAPQYEKKKIPYLLQAPDQVDLSVAWEELLRTPRPANLKDPPVYQPAFTTECGTGTRYERKKRTGRPFYSQSAPFSAISSHLNTHARDFLQLSRQSLFGSSKATRSHAIGEVLREDTRDATMVKISDDKAKYSPHMDENSQLMMAEFQAELAGEPNLVGHIQHLLQGDLLYRVHGHLVRYPSNGTDREGMRAGLNTLLEIVIQGLSSRLCQDKGYLKSAVFYQAFIDDALRNLPVAGKTESDVDKNLDAIMDDIVFGQRVMGREMSWDKAFVSLDFATILGDIWWRGSWIGAGLKAFALFGETEVDEAPVMTLASWESLYFSKAQGARSSGAPLTLAYSQYVYETLAVLGRGQRRPRDLIRPGLTAGVVMSICPQFMGGLGLRTPANVESPESAVSNLEALSAMQRAGLNDRSLEPLILSALANPMKEPRESELIRNPETLSYAVPRAQPGRVVAAMRDAIKGAVISPFAKQMMKEAAVSESHLLAHLHLAFQMGRIHAAETIALYRSSALRQVDEFITKIASSDVARTLLGKDGLNRQRALARKDLRKVWQRWTDESV